MSLHDVARTLANLYRTPARSASASKHDGQIDFQRLSPTVRQASSGSTLNATTLRRRHFSQIGVTIPKI
jgi:hypothetical protein